MSEDIKRIDIAEFRREGYLQELNRRFLHPLGLAMEVHIDDDTGEESLGGVWDYRDDPEGICYEGADLSEKAKYIDGLWDQREEARRSALGYMVQPDRTPLMRRVQFRCEYCGEFKDETVDVMSRALDELSDDHILTVHHPDIRYEYPNGAD